MLECKHLIKDYQSGDDVVHALRDVSFSFRDHEFVSILGPSGCGKTTLLNIIGGLDHYTSGDLVINGRSTKDYNDQDWDTYRNHKVGFVFQTYNLIMHQNVLSNVELALTLTGVSKEERKARAKDVLTRVGLKDQLYKKPTQLSGGQMQRVAIARALINNPEILLADEPTGALDSETSVQIMDILKEISQDTLVIMVTHNPELADQYSTRIIKLLDGKVKSDSNPVQAIEMTPSDDHEKRPSMNFVTALSLSLNNLMTKKGRTFLTSFAGSIGIIGIALILSLSNGMQKHIDQVENDTMASYPISIQDNSMDMGSLIATMMAMEEDSEKDSKDGKIETRKIVTDMLDSLSNTKKNNMEAFKNYIESDKGKKLRNATKAIEYQYNILPIVYNEDTSNGLVQVSPNGLLSRLGMSDFMNSRNQMVTMTASMDGSEVWSKLPDDKTLRDDNYELIEGSWPNADNEVVLAVDQNEEISDYVLYALGLMDQNTLVSNYKKFLSGDTEKLVSPEVRSYTKEELMDIKFRLIPNANVYEKGNGVWIDRSQDEDYMKDIIASSKEVKVVGIIKPKENVNQSFYGKIFYSKEMQDYIIKAAEDSEIAKEQMANKSVNVFTGKDFSDDSSFDVDSLSPEQQMQLASMSQEELMSYMNSYNDNANATYQTVMNRLGVVDTDKPSSINLYVSDFESKEKLADEIEAYNKKVTDKGNKDDVITYTDFIGVMLRSVTGVIDLISYVLIGFVSVALVVSSIMIGIITYISVLERIKEIGILRSIGASKKDISRVFNAETFIVGLISGVLGIVITCLLLIPLNLIVQHYSGVSGIAKLPWQGAIILILLSLFLTMLAGLIPARIASKKDPVEALRTE